MVNCGDKMRLFELLGIVLNNGGYFAKINEIDALIDKKHPGFFIKHDIHGLNLKFLLSFAEEEISYNVKGTYFFMYPEHPLTIKHYSLKEQLEAMSAINQMGHDLGLHIDPFYLIAWKRKTIDEILKEALSIFKEYKINLYCGNIHGHSNFKGLDVNQFGTSFDLFEEIARQPDYPELKDVPPETADVIRANRVNLTDYGFTHWGDMPFWSKKNKYVVTNYISDNYLKKKGHLNILVQKDTLRQYKLSDKQPPGAFTTSFSRKYIPILKEIDNSLPEGLMSYNFHSIETESFFKKIANHPVQFLVHPQFYI